MTGFRQYHIFAEQIIIRHLPMKTPKKESQETEDSIPLPLRSPLQQLVVYQRKTYINSSLSILKTPLEVEVRRIPKNNVTGQNLLLLVLNNHIKAIMELNGSNNGSGKSSFQEKTIIHEELAAQFLEGDQQLNKLIVLNVDLSKAQGALELGIKYFTNRTYRHRANKFVESRVRLLELILAVLRSSNENNNHDIVPPLPELKANLTSFKELEVSHVRLIVEELDQKVYELSTISQQIPQLETFKRTLDLTTPEHNAYLTKIVNVLIQLHHKINKLVSRRPQKLLRQIQQVDQQCFLIQQASSSFIELIQSPESTKLKCIYFDQRTNKSPDHFRKIQKNVVKLSEIIIQCLQVEAESQEKIMQIKGMIEIFWNLIAGMEEYERQWKEYRNRANKSVEEEQIIQMLELCLKFVDQRMEKMEQQFQMERQAMIDAHTKNTQFLEEDISRMSRENDEYRAIIEELEKQNEDLRKQVNDLFGFENKNQKIVSDLQDLRLKYALMEKREKNYKDKIESLEAENQQKKIMITNITNDLKRVIKQSQNSWKLQQKNRDLQDMINKLNPQIDSLDLQLLTAKQDIIIANRDREQFEKNNQLMMKKLMEANKRVTDLENQIVDIKIVAEREMKIFQQEFAKRGKNQSMQETTVKLDIKVKELEKKEVEHRQTLVKKDEKITQLNTKIIDLNNKLNEMLNQYKGIQFELKKKEIAYQDLTMKVKETEQHTSSSFNDLMKSYENSQRQLNNALAELDIIRNKTVPELEAQIWRRDEAIANLQRYINQFEERQRRMLQQEQNSVNLKRQFQEILLKIKAKDDSLIVQQNKARELEGQNRDQQSKIRDLETQIRGLQNKLREFEGGQVRDQQAKARELQGQSRDQQAKIRQLQGQIKIQQGKTKDLESQQLRNRELQGQIRDYQTKIREFEGQLRMQQTKERQLESQQAKVRQLQGKNRDQLTRIRQLEGGQSKDQQVKQAQLRDLQAKLRDMQAQIRDKDRKIKEQDQIQKSNNTKISQLSSQLQTLTSDKSKQSLESTRIKSLQSQNTQLRLDLDRKIALLESQKTKQKTDYQLKLSDIGKELNQLKQIHYQSNQLSGKIKLLEGTLNEKNQYIGELQFKVRGMEGMLNEQHQYICGLEFKLAGLQNVLRDLERELEKARGYSEELKAKEKQILMLRQEKSLFEGSKGSDSRMKELLKETEFLKEKVRSLEDLIDSLNQDLQIVSVKYREIKAITISGNRSITQKQSTEISSRLQKASQQNMQMSIFLKNKSEQIERLNKKIADGQKMTTATNKKAEEMTTIANKRQQENNALRLKVEELERENVMLRNKLMQSQNKVSEDKKGWFIQEKQFNEHIGLLRAQLAELQAKILDNQKGSVKIGEKYYLRSEGENLETILKKMELGNSRVSEKLDEILSSSNRKFEFSPESNDIHSLMDDNRALINQIQKAREQKQQLSKMLQDYPNPNFLTEYVLRIITHFCQLAPESPQTKTIWQQLIRIRNENSGEQYFIVLEEFTKYTLQQSCLQIYRRELKHKSQELEELRVKLNKLIQDILAKQETVFQKTALTRTKVLMFREKIVNVGK